MQLFQLAIELARVVAHRIHQQFRRFGFNFHFHRLGGPFHLLQQLLRFPGRNRGKFLNFGVFGLLEQFSGLEAAIGLLAGGEQQNGIVGNLGQGAFQLSQPIVGTALGQGRFRQPHQPIARTKGRSHRLGQGRQQAILVIGRDFFKIKAFPSRIHTRSQRVDRPLHRKIILTPKPINRHFVKRWRTRPRMLDWRMG